MVSSRTSSSIWQPGDSLPAPALLMQTPAPESNHWLNVGDRFVFLGGDNQDFRALVVEATHRAALVPFEGKVARRSVKGSNRKPVEMWFPYVEATRVFVDPGESWFRVLGSYESMAKARSLGVPSRRWLFLDGRDEPTKECPTALGTRKAAEFVQAVLDLDDEYAEDEESGTWTVGWELMVGAAEAVGDGNGWRWKDDLQYGFIWPADVEVSPKRQSRPLTARNR